MQGEKRIKGKRTIIVIGFNARPIALSAKRDGYTVLAVDYWGDIDLAKSVDDVETILRQIAGKRPRQELTKPLSELLVERAETISARHHGEVDFILLGSGLDDRPDLWERLRKTAPVLGNPVEVLRRVRNRFELFKTASSLGIPSPVTFEASSCEECLRVSERIGYPLVLKPLGGGGGTGIKLVNNDPELRRIYLNEMRPKFGDSVFLQEYVKGKHVSASVVGDGNECAVVTVNEQLMGLKELGASTPFVWCGSVVPLSKSVRDARVKAVASAARSLGEALKVVGSNGFDFVLRHEDRVPVIIECNPRFQGTLECVEMVTGINLVNEHVSACRGNLRTDLPRPIRYATKMIAFAKAECAVGDLSDIRGTGDIPPPGVVVEQGDPICTVHGTAETRDLSIRNTRNTVMEVYSRVHST